MFTPSTEVRQRLELTWGVQSINTPEVANTDEMVEQVDVILRERGLAEEGDRVVIVSGMPPGKVGSTNTIRIHKMGETFKSVD